MLTAILEYIEYDFSAMVCACIPHVLSTSGWLCILTASRSDVDPAVEVCSQDRSIYEVLAATSVRTIREFNNQDRPLDDLEVDGQDIRRSCNGAWKSMGIGGLQSGF